MIIHYDLDSLPTFKNAVITIGSFDGVHQGHQQIIKRIISLSKEVNGCSVLITFHPHPRFVLGKDVDSLKLIHTLDEKAYHLEKLGVDHLVVVPFSKVFASQSPSEYIEQFLVAKFKPSVIVIGYDHKFGKNRAGNFDLLEQCRDQYAYQLIEISKKDVANITVSSTKVRQALHQGDVKKAFQLLGHPFVLSGRVVKGQQVGSKIGFPTANIQLNDEYKLIPPDGIYAVQVEINDQRHDGMMYIGNRPTLEDGLGRSIEVNIFDFDQDIYGENVLVFCLERIRNDQTFSSLDEMVEQLKRDYKSAIDIHKSLSDDNR